MAANPERLWRKVRYVQVFYSLVTKNSFRENEEQREVEHAVEQEEVSSQRKAILNIYQISTSHLGLVVLLLLYTFTGAGIFHAIEGRKHRISDGIILEQDRNITLDDATRDINRMDFTDLQVQNITAIFRQHILESEERLLRKGLLILKKDESEIWSYWAAVGFCVSVYSTIGYGHMAPSTTAGRWVCVVYAIIGIPLCLITLADLGLSFSKGLKYFYRKAMHRFKKKPNLPICTKTRNEEKSLQDENDTSGLPDTFPQDMQCFNQVPEECRTSQNCVDQQKDLPSDPLLKDQKKIFLSNHKADISNTGGKFVSGYPNELNRQAIMPGLPNSEDLQKHLNHQHDSKLTNKNKKAAENVVNQFKLTMQAKSAPATPVLHRMLVNERATRLIQHALVGIEDKGKPTQSQNGDDSIEHSHVPMILPVLITMIYILIGVLIYSQWEGWDFTEAFYFTFISLSTIGFGDFISTGKYVMVSIMYQLLGLALVAMTLTFLMELTNATLGKAKYKVDCLAEKRFGLTVKDNDPSSHQRVPIGVPLKNRKLKTQLSEFI